MNVVSYDQGSKAMGDSQSSQPDERIDLTANESLEEDLGQEEGINCGNRGTF